ncbi:hypothetical protein [Allobranchiibius sp. GilTou73]|uniref:hypothetical protein n=1 Tax=Allobranchiibius sp. GilTou73 TaxID=2904523 RepID=UPI001F1C829B|nr:hypothetical protein [Allobranchiibius sp. GilTou73]UIJ35124.1 hypothetical protein LVQ62_01560 [Allobranchiibius sp. GilTou73]
MVVEKLLPRDEALWLTGGELRSLDDLWERVIEFLNLYDQVQWTTGADRVKSGGLSATVGVPGVGSVTGNLGGSAGSSSQVTTSARRPIAAVAREALVALNVPVVVDDFHYVPDTLKLDLVRAIKGLITDVPVVMIAVPHDAFRVVREETDMLGRLWQQEITPWSLTELVYIARSGFAALNMIDPGDQIAKKFAENSLGAPFLMQQLCLDYCLSSGIRETANASVQMNLPAHVEGFFQDIATRYVPGVFELLRRGPRTKGQPRLARKLKTGQSTDIYGAVLYGLARMGPVREIPTQRLARVIAEHFEDPPTTQNVAFALGRMNAIADKNKGNSDPALAYVDDTLSMSDPFLSFYLRFGKWDLPNPPTDAV